MGDVDFEGVSPKASYITPVPGGVGPMTVVMLMENTLVAAAKQHGLKEASVLKCYEQGGAPGQKPLDSRRKISISQLARGEHLRPGEPRRPGRVPPARRLVVCYVARDYEVQTAGMIVRLLAEGKRVAVPLVDDPSQAPALLRDTRARRALAREVRGTRTRSRWSEPVPLSETNLVLVPLVAWDDRGHRIGYGRGYFDRALAHARAVGRDRTGASNRSAFPTIPEAPRTSAWTWWSPRRGS